MTSGIPVRTPYQGLRQILHYNRPFYIRTLAGVITAIILAMWLPFVVRALLLPAAGVAVFWTCISLLVSHYVYDRSPLYSLRWLNECLSRPPARWVNIHSGVDETSRIISSMFPGSQGQIIDTYDPREMTEPSIEEARRITKAPFADTDW